VSCSWVYSSLRTIFWKIYRIGAAPPAPGQTTTPPPTSGPLLLCGPREGGNRGWWMGCSSLLHTWAASPSAVVEGLATGGVAQPRGQCTRAPMLRLLDPGHVGAHRARVAAIPSSTTRKTTRRGRGSNSVHLAFVAPGIGQRGGREGEGGWSLRSTGEEEGPTSLAPLPPSLLRLCCSSVSLAPPAPLNPQWARLAAAAAAWARLAPLVARAAGSLATPVAPHRGVVCI
jgi:hypothetical protein